MGKHLLQGRGLYVGLFIIVVLLYAHLLVTGSPMKALSDTKHEMAASLAAPKHAPSKEMTLAEVQTAAGRHPRLGLMLIGWGFIALGLGLGGVVLTIRAWLRGRFQRVLRYRSRLPYLWSLHDIGRLFLLLLMVFSLLPFVNLGLIAWGLLRLTDTRLWMLLAMFLLEVFLVLFVWGFASARRLSLSKALGLSWRKSPRAIWHGLVAYMTMFPWVFGFLWLIGQVCEWFSWQPPVEPIQTLLFQEHDPLIVGLTLVLSCVVGPIVEEIFFRGLIFSALRRHSSRLVAMVVSASLFAAAHTNLVGFVPILVLGCLLAYLYERTGSLMGPMAVHIVHNGLLVGLAMTMKALVGHG